MIDQSIGDSANSTALRHIIMEATDDSEVKFARKLAANETPKRREAILGLTKFLTARSKAEKDGSLPEIELRKLWRGLFFSMWLADKQPVQAELADKIAKLIHCFETVEGARSWLLVCGRTLRGEWGKLDKYRLDKFYGLLRRVVHEGFAWGREGGWHAGRVEAVAAALTDGYFAHPTPNGVRLHVADLYVDELFAAGGAGVAGDASIPTAALMTLLGPILRVTPASASSYY